jgi:hypothetical protein
MRETVESTFQKVYNRIYIESISSKILNLNLRYIIRHVVKMNRARNEIVKINKN